MKRAVWFLLLTAVLLSAAACSPSGGEPSTTPVPVVKVATNPEFEPFEFIDDKQNIAGFDIDLMNALADKLGWHIEYSDMPFESVVASVQSGACEVGISGLTINAERAESVNFSVPYYSASQIILVAAGDSTYDGKTKDEIDALLAGKKIGVCAGFVGIDYVEGYSEDGEVVYPGIAGATAVTYSNISLAIAGLKSGSIEAIVMDNIVAIQAAATPENSAAVKAVEVALTEEDYGIIVGKADTERLNAINTALQQLFDDGTVAGLVAQWIG